MIKRFLKNHEDAIVLIAVSLFVIGIILFAIAEHMIPLIRDLKYIFS